MASATGEIELTPEGLRAKYLELARKYAALVERLDRRTARNGAVFQLGSWGMQMRGAALAMVVGGRIELANARFNQLATQGRGAWGSEPPGAKLYPDLPSLVIDQARKLRTGASERVRDSRFRHSRQDLVISLRMEKSRQGKRPVVLAMIEDVSDEVRRDQELYRTREGLMNRERLRVLGELAAAVAHDLGSTLRGASFQLASLRMAHPDLRTDAVEGAARRVEIASQIVGRLHDFARGGSAAPTQVRIERVLAQAITLADLELRGGENPVRVRTALPELPPVRGSAAELALLFVTLLRNARDAMPRGGSVTISARRTKRELVVTVADQGEGIAEENLPRLFKPFFTTKGARGSGLGLWLANGTMERLGGTIRAANRPQRGALFTLRFPLAEVSPSARSRAARPAAPASPAPRRRKRGPRSGRRP